MGEACAGEQQPEQAVARAVPAGLLLSARESGRAAYQRPVGNCYFPFSPSSFVRRIFHIFNVFPHLWCGLFAEVIAGRLEDSRRARRRGVAMSEFSIMALLSADWQQKLLFLPNLRRRRDGGTRPCCCERPTRQWVLLRDSAAQFHTTTFHAHARLQLAAKLSNNHLHGSTRHLSAQTRRALRGAIAL